MATQSSRRSGDVAYKPNNQGQSDGYTIEQEKRYTVEIPNPNWTHYKDFVTGLVKLDDGIVICQTSKPSKLTEAEIRKDFEWAWDAGFAKEVADDTEF